MELGINLGYVRRQRGNPQGRTFLAALQLCRDAGFAHLDYLSELSDDWERIAHQRRQELDSLGLVVHQAHCPFFRYQEDGTARFAQLAPRAVRAAAILGAQYLVVHADEYRVTDRFDAGEILTATYGYLAPVVDLAKQHHVRVAVENLFEDGHGPQVNGRSRYTATVEEVLAVIDRFNDPDVGCCWDFGHARCSYGDRQLDALRQIGPHLFCTHLHDNYYNKDLHLPPFFGSTDWEAHMRYLRDSAYCGNLTYEFVYGAIPDALLPAYLRIAYQTGQHLLSMAQ